MEACYALYIDAKSNTSCDEQFSIHESIRKITADEVKTITTQLKKDVRLQGMTVVHHCDTLGTFHASCRNYTLTVEAIPYGYD